MLQYDTISFNSIVHMPVERLGLNCNSEDASMPLYHDKTIKSISWQIIDDCAVPL
jgi:hypothetical protein